VKISSQNSYSPSLGAGSLRTTVPETCSPDCRCTSINGMKQSWRRSSRWGEDLDALVVVLFGVTILPYVFIGKTCLRLQCPVTNKR
jgi:hypothetical protein